MELLASRSGFLTVDATSRIPGSVDLICDISLLQNYSVVRMGKHGIPIRKYPLFPHLFLGEETRH
ncbi:hypothetical protein MsedC_1043 [Metallosphaera sedula]|uniref:Uncharacterized protein n=2 Tax=Metallosphaera TaxID=41980 RepID=A0A0K1T1T0_9CREN|nr:hypothetical protein MsedA_1043 [Metallosphaera sedula]QCO29307.1 hypothetical protein DFR88_01370 [Metallosphaera prunae]AKV76320.1 hypothetical protein MsedB_1045 [Metallosphaera sedula]AKV78571.1 hypothetical protein MsedC_1043 [Metallosphaera sedula]AKV80816.1 hypothetical protein MsedD_1044 [Metallosphaera sedula]